MRNWIIGCLLLCANLNADPFDWVAYSAFQLTAGHLVDNPSLNNAGIEGEISSFPYTVPSGYNLIIDYIQVEGPDAPQFGMFVWLGEFPCTNAKAIISCTTPGGSIQLHGMNIKIPEDTKVNIRCMNNTLLNWIFGIYLQGHLEAIP